MLNCSVNWYMYCGHLTIFYLHFFIWIFKGPWRLATHPLHTWFAYFYTKNVKLQCQLICCGHLTMFSYPFLFESSRFKACRCSWSLLATPFIFIPNFNKNVKLLQLTYSLLSFDEFSRFSRLGAVHELTVRQPFIPRLASISIFLSFDDFFLYHNYSNHLNALLFQARCGPWRFAPT